MGCRCFRQLLINQGTAWIKQDSKPHRSKQSAFAAGGGSAYDVTLDDETWPEAKFSFKKGNGTGSWEKLVPQGSVSTSYVVTTSTPGMFVPPAAKVTFRDSSKPSPQVCRTLPVL